MTREKRQGRRAGKKAAREARRPDRRETSPGASLWILLAILGATFLAYLPSLGNGFTNWDDSVYVTANRMVQGPLAQNLGALFTTPVSLNYHPITMLSLAIDRAVQGPAARGFHLTSLIFHLLNTALVFRLAYLLSRRRIAVAAVTALIFGLHPMHVESVAWVSGRKDMLYVFFFLAGLLAWLRYRIAGRWAWYGAAFLLFLASALSKAMAVVFPLVLLLVDDLQGRRWTRKLFLETAPFFVAAVGFGVAALVIQSKEAVSTVYPLGERLVFACYGLMMYAVKLVVPVRLSAFYPYPPAGAPLPPVFWVAPILVLAAGAGAVMWRRRSRVPGFALGFYLVTVMLVLQVLSVGQAILADRYTYLSYFGLAFLLGWILDTVLTSRLRPQTAAWTLAVLGTLGGAALGVATRDRTRVWADSGVLWTNVIRNYPTAAEAYANRGSYYGETGRVPEAVTDLKQAVSLNGNSARYLELLGTAYGASGEFDKALETLAEALRVDPTSPGAWLNRAVTYSLMGRPEDAIPAYQKALDFDTSDPIRVYVGRGRANVAAGHLNEAISDAQSALARDPGNGAAQIILALVYRAHGDTTRALDHARRALAAGSPEAANLIQQLSGGGGGTSP